MERMGKLRQEKQKKRQKYDFAEYDDILDYPVIFINGKAYYVVNIYK